MPIQMKTSQVKMSPKMLPQTVTKKMIKMTKMRRRRKIQGQRFTMMIRLKNPSQRTIFLLPKVMMEKEAMMMKKNSKIKRKNERLQNLPVVRIRKTTRTIFQPANRMCSFSNFFVLF